MKKLTNEVKFEIAVQIGQLFEINGEGMELEALVNAINEQIEILNQPKVAKAGKWFENTELAFKPGEIADVIGGWAEGRMVQIEKPSAKVDAYKAYLINKTTGETQGTLVTVEAKDLQLYIKNEETEIKEEIKEEEVVA